MYFAEYIQVSIFEIYAALQLAKLCPVNQVTAYICIFSYSCETYLSVFKS